MYGHPDISPPSAVRICSLGGFQSFRELGILIQAYAARGGSSAGLTGTGLSGWLEGVLIIAFPGLFIY